MTDTNEAKEQLTSDPERSRLNRYAWLIAISWSTVISVSLAWNHIQLRRGTLEVARIEARTIFQKDVFYRRWSAMLGGVYAQVTERTQPNPYLHVPERDIQTPSGRQLTLINPAYMTRQVHELQAKEIGVQGHITSLNPIRPENAADPWETEALKAFRRGETEKTSIEELNCVSYLRLMRPLKTEQACLKCHAAQGYKLGDIRGGISVSVPMAPLQAIAWKHSVRQALAHSALWLLGLLGVSIGRRRILKGINDREQAEETLRESEKRLLKAQQVARMGFLDWNLKTDEIYLSDEVSRLYGLDPKETLTTPELVARVVHPDDLDHVRKNLDLAVLGVREYNIDHRIVRPDGDILWIHAQAELVYGPNGEPETLLGTVVDITNRKRAEEMLRFTQFAVDSTSDGAFWMGPDARFIYVNYAACRSLGYSRQELLTMSVHDIDPNFTPDAWPDHWRDLKERDSFTIESLHRAKDGKTFPIEITVNFVEFEGKEYNCAFARNITERKRAEEEKQSLEAQLRHQQKLDSIGTLASGVAHEINNPISGVMGYAQLIKDRLDANNPLVEYADGIIHETKRVAAIVRNLLAFARQEQQEHVPTRLSDIAEGTLSLIRTVIRRDQITLEVDVPEDLPILRCRSQQIQQVLMNLMTNARDALNKRYPEYDANKITKVTAHALEKEGEKWIRITVEDHGDGIPPEIKDRIFDPFFTTKDRATGTGLGLSISHGIVQEHKGELHAESEPGQYTRFHLDLPADEG